MLQELYVVLFYLLFSIFYAAIVHALFPGSIVLKVVGAKIAIINPTMKR